MLDDVLLWAMHNPLAFVGILALTGAWVGVTFVPLFHEINGQRHPRL